MINIIKKLFTKNKEQPSKEDIPGRTFKRILTGRYFGCEDLAADEAKHLQEKQDKITQIKALELLPMYIKYTYDERSKESAHKKIIAAHVAFQKEVLAEKWNMIHVTEISFTVPYDNFEEFEKMAGVQLHKDFRDVTPSQDTNTYKGKERRKQTREET